MQRDWFHNACTDHPYIETVRNIHGLGTRKRTLPVRLPDDLDSSEKKTTIIMNKVKFFFSDRAYWGGGFLSLISRNLVGRFR